MSQTYPLAILAGNIQETNTFGVTIGNYEIIEQAGTFTLTRTLSGLGASYTTTDGDFSIATYHGITQTAVLAMNENATFFGRNTSKIFFNANEARIIFPDQFAFETQDKSILLYYEDSTWIWEAGSVLFTGQLEADSFKAASATATATSTNWRLTQNLTIGADDATLSPTIKSGGSLLTFEGTTASTAHSFDFQCGNANTGSDPLSGEGVQLILWGRGRRLPTLASPTNKERFFIIVQPTKNNGAPSFEWSATGTGQQKDFYFRPGINRACVFQRAGIVTPTASQTITTINSISFQISPTANCILLTNNAGSPVTLRMDCLLVPEWEGYKIDLVNVSADAITIINNDGLPPYIRLSSSIVLGQYQSVSLRYVNATVGWVRVV